MDDGIFNPNIKYQVGDTVTIVKKFSSMYKDFHRDWRPNDGNKLLRGKSVKITSIETHHENIGGRVAYKSSYPESNIWLAEDFEESYLPEMPECSPCSDDELEDLLGGFA